jgi:hypothetical protein
MTHDDRIDDYGRLTLDPDDRTTIAAWAVLQFGKIDPALIFPNKEHAGVWASGSLADQKDIVPVVVTGTTIERV